jgi:FixJ family two-component response regulator
MDANVTVFVVDDDAAARESVVALVSEKGVKATAFASAEEFLDRFDPQMTGCLVVDVRMAGMSGLQLLQHLQAKQSTLPAIVITGYADVPLAVKAMQAGAMTFLEKPCQDQELWQAIQQALDLELSQQMIKRQKGEIESRLASLTEDEVAVLRKLLEGLPNRGGFGHRTADGRAAALAYYAEDGGGLAAGAGADGHSGRIFEGGVFDLTAA